MEMSAAAATALIAIATVVLAASLAVWHIRQRAAFRSALAKRGLQVSLRGDETTVTPETGDWTVSMTRSFAAQMSPPGSRITVSTWTSPTPRVAGAVLIVGPAPPPELRTLTVALLGSTTPAMTNWLGIDRVSGGRPLESVSLVDDRLLAFSTAGYPHPGHLTGMADAISAWCSRYGSEREQPAVTVDDNGVRVRVRYDVLRSLKQVDAFVELGLRCRDGLRP